MLLNLHVKNFAIIQEIEVDFSKRLNILTGETGAGKSIIIGSINIALGGKVSPDFIRKGAEFGFVELVFSIEDKEVRSKMEAMDIPVEDNLIILSRKITKTRSISKINGETVTAAVVRSIANSLIDLHGQHEHQSLLYKRKHLDIVDRYSKDAYGSLMEKLSQTYHNYTCIRQELERTEIPEEERIRELSFMEYEIHEIESAHLVEGEEEELESEFKRLSNASEITEGVGNVYQITGEGSQCISDEISRAGRIFGKLEEYDTVLQGLSRQLAELDNLINDFNRELSDYIEGIEFNDGELKETESRLNLIHNLKAKYGNTYQEIQTYYQKLLEKKKHFEDYDQYREIQKRKLADAENELRNLCEKVSSIRKESARDLGFRIQSALVDLNFLDVKFQISFQKLDHFTENGMDEVEFLIATNPGEELKPLGRVASGGELSRIMLAIKSVLAKQDAIGTLIFDEIDVGISGRTAQKVSEKLAMIAKNHQIISITHLPQIAAMADTHYVIEKTTNGFETATNIRRLNQTESIEELARMLSGAKVTETVLGNAREMKDLASTTKKY